MKKKDEEEHFRKIKKGGTRKGKKEFERFLYDKRKVGGKKLTRNEL